MSDDLTTALDAMIDAPISLAALHDACERHDAVTPAAVLALIEAVEAAHRAVVLEYDPARTEAENKRIGHRAKGLFFTLRRFDFAPGGATPEEGT